MANNDGSVMINRDLPERLGDPTRGLLTTPSSVTPAVSAAFLQHVMDGYGLNKAARLVGVSGNTIRHRRLKDPGFDTAVLEATQIAIGEVERALFEACVEDRNINAIKFFLCNRARDQWKSEKHTHTHHSGEVDIQVTALARQIVQGGAIEHARESLRRAASESDRTRLPGRVGDDGRPGLGASETP